MLKDFTYFILSTLFFFFTIWFTLDGIKSAIANPQMVAISALIVIATNAIAILIQKRDSKARIIKGKLIWKLAQNSFSKYTALVILFIIQLLIVTEDLTGKGSRFLFLLMFVLVLLSSSLILASDPEEIKEE